MSERIQRIQNAIEKVHGCKATHSGSAPVHEVFQNMTAWQGLVEIFTVDHPKAKRCYAWEIPDTKDCVAVLEIPPVVSPATAVRAYIASLGRK